MPQLMLPLIPKGATEIGNFVSVYNDGNICTYFMGMNPVYNHRTDNVKMFRLVTSQLIDSGACRHSHIIKTFGVAKSSVNRALKKLREEGVEGFFKKQQRKKKGTVLTPDVLEKAQSLLDKENSRRDTADELGILPDTLRKAINDGRLREPVKKKLNR